MENIELQKNSHEIRFNFTSIDNEIFFDNRLNIYQKHILWFFNIVSINKNYSYYSIKNIAKLTNLSVATIKRNIPQLIELQYIEKKQDTLHNGFKHNYYFLKDIKKTTLKELLENHNVSDRATIHGLTDTNTWSDRATIHGLTEPQRNTNIIKTNNKNTKSNNLETIDIIQDDKLTNDSFTSLSLNKDYKITNSNNIKAKDNIKNLKLTVFDSEYDEASNTYKQVDIQKENNINLIKNAIATSSINVLDSKTFKSIDDINMFDSYFNENAKEYGKQYPYYLNRMLEVHTYDYKTTFNILEHFIRYDFLDMSFLSFCNAIVVLANDLINANIKSIFELCKGKDKVQVIENLFNQFVSKKIDIVNFIYEYKDFIENNFSEWYSKQAIHTKKASIVKQLINQMECFINE